MSAFCRICRVQIFSQPIPLSNSSLRHSKLIYDMIFECTQIMLTKDTRLPQVLCQACAIRLDEAFAFLQQCRESEQMLVKTLPATESPEKQTVTEAVKLELLPVPFNSYGHVLLEASSTDPTGKDWMSEARKHRERQRISTARRRANMTPEQRDKERERARIRQAQRRAARNDDEVRAQRERDRVRQAIKRAKFREVELVGQNRPHGQSYALEPGLNPFE
ncbi:hypothetical protein quinque_011596 [Culex quinquefasciatus]